ncbi:MAG TPA: ABC transporter ATP-binding protein [Anaerolineaceae bacterium]|jgi:ABC-2 type transport system ATP-binding protein|nr:ABC transporter ATP-binding protein [Anaerolineaceae bacterium]HQH85581.1 ABC transporter ATP-binding protein [Anaerolineaceae bacterium]
MDIAIQAESLTKIYPNQRGLPALRDLDLTIPAGILFGLVGPDGAGKTTALRILSSVMLPTSGAVHVLGYDTRRQPDPIRQKIGYMPQNFSLYPDLTVAENLNFFADIQQVSPERKRSRIPEMLRFTRLQDFQTRRAAKLSGGMKKKLALACALVHEPQILILDEPSTGVDPVSRRELWVILSAVAEQGVTVLVSTPYMDEAERCHQVGVLYQGQMMAVGTPDELKQSLPFEILELKVSPRKRMRQIAAETPGVIEWRPVGDTLRLTTAIGSAQTVLRQLSRRLNQEDVQVHILRQTRSTMEDVFVHLVNIERGRS